MQPSTAMTRVSGPRAHRAVRGAAGTHSSSLRAAVVQSRRQTSHRFRRRASPRKRDTNLDPGTIRWLRIDRDVASEMKYPLAHADEPESALAVDRPGVEPDAVIDDLQ